MAIRGHKHRKYGHTINGAAVELKLCGMFLMMGYEVFRNVSPTGPADFVLRKKGVCVPVDATRGSMIVKENGEKSYYKPGNQKIQKCKENGILCVSLYDDGTFIEHTCGYVFSAD